MKKVNRFFCRAAHFVLCRLSRLNEKVEAKLQRYSPKEEMPDGEHLIGRKNPDPFFENVRIITHAGGGLQGMAYLNCADAPSMYYNYGNKTFEFDIQESVDGKFVASHDSVNITEAEFLCTKIDGRFAPIKIEEILAFTIAHTDVTIIFDCKVGNLKRFAQYLKEHLAGTDAIDRVVVQVFREQDILDIRQVYDFKMLHVCMYAADYAVVAQRCLEYGIGAVSVSEKAIAERNGWQLFAQKNICVFAYTVNTRWAFKALQQKKITGVFSDFLLERDIV